MTTEEKEKEMVLSDLRDHLRGDDSGTGMNDDGSSSSYDKAASVALPVAAIKVLLCVIQRSTANTMMGLQDELKSASDHMLQFAHQESNSVLLGGRSHIALASGCELFLSYVTRCFLELPDFTACIAQVLERGERFAGISVAARDRIAEVGQNFIQDGQTVLTHGWSRVVASLLLKASKQNKHFEILILEGRPDASGAKAAKVFADAGIPTTVLLDSAVGYVMEKVDLVIVGAEGVVENGGIVNKIGTYATAIAAKELGKPFYVAAESYKFARLFPLNQSDLPESMSDNPSQLDFVDTTHYTNHTTEQQPQQPSTTTTIPGLVDYSKYGDMVKVKNPKCDYTPAKYITLLLTDLGVLTPSAVSDELIRLYQ